jgi:FkbH-like protein
MPQPYVPEPVRLVIWDLDEVFWSGTLSEGGIEYSQSNHDIVVELARRGIMSSICSKNNHQIVKNILVERGLWDYFVFPSIDWSPKGARVAAIIQDMNLRPNSVMFIDDNPMNLREVRHFLPDVQVSDEKILSSLLGNPLFRGKDDKELSRLAQYKVLEKKKQDIALSNDNTGFLRASGINIRIEYDVEAHIDRAVELVNRTNQLNFTKRRLPDDQDEARKQLLSLISNHWVTAGLLFVSDKYGDYGCCGFYVISRTQNGASLVHFCFSCRALNMGVEVFVFNLLGRPPIHVVGPVLTDLLSSDPVDWITLDLGDGAASGDQNSKLIGSLHLSGGCDLLALEHYLAPFSEKVLRRVDTVQDGRPLRLEHSSLIARTLRPLTGRQADAFIDAGYGEEHLSASFFDASTRSVWIFSFWADAHLHLYRDKDSGEVVPVHIHELIDRDITASDVIEVPERWLAPYASLKSKFEHLGRIQKAQFVDNLREILGSLPQNAIVFFILLNDPDQKLKDVNSWATEVLATDARRIEIIKVMNFVQKETEIHSINHFDRIVYHRISKDIIARLTDSVRDVETRPLILRSATASEPRAGLMTAW